MHLNLVKHKLFDEVLSLPVCFVSQGSNEQSQREHVMGRQLDVKRNVSLVDVNVSIFESYNTLNLTPIEDYAFVCELPNFLHFQFKRWVPGGHANLSAIFWSSKLKQWDPGKFIQGCIFYNLEDMVVLNGVDIVMSRAIGCRDSGLRT